MKHKYRILHDWGSEGHGFYEDKQRGISGEYETVAEAVKAAIELNYSPKFLIVEIVEWEAQITQ